MIEFVSNCSHKKNWTPKPDFGYDFAGLFILVRLKMYTLTTLKSKPLPIPIYSTDDKYPTNSSSHPICR